MSRPFYTKFLNILKEFPLNSEKEIEQVYNKTVIYGLGISTLGHLFYTFGTLKYEMIKVKQKYKFTRNGFTEFMIVDSKGYHYNINNSLWLLKFDSIEDWDEIEPDKHIIVKYYGLRIPFLGLFPNIIMSNQRETLKSINRRELHDVTARAELFGVITRIEINEFMKRNFVGYF